jgi:ribosome biogenesis GTPase
MNAPEKIAVSSAPTVEGVIRKSAGQWYEVLTADNETIPCRVRGKLRLVQHRQTNLLAVGDRVEVEYRPGSDQSRIVGVLPRRNAMIRKANKSTSYRQTLAANLERAVVIASLCEPRTSQGFIDRFLVASEAYGISPLIVFNKADRLDEEGCEQLSDFEAMYQQLGYATLRTVATTGEGAEALKEYLEGQLVVFCGHSGVGKSTLINALQPELSLRTSSISTAHQKGKHTTTHAEMHRLFGDTFVIDTPGIREYGLVDYQPEEISHYMPEFRAYLEQCRFNDCTHTHEPGCAIIEAAEAGLIRPSRYDSYLSMVENHDHFE